MFVERAGVRIQSQTHTRPSAEGGRKAESLGTGRAGRDVEGEEGVSLICRLLPGWSVGGRER